MKTSGSEPRGEPRADHVVLDTSAYSRFRAGHAEVAAWLSRATTIAIPTTVLGELEAGFALGARAAENRVALAELLDEPFVRVLDVTREVALRYGALFVALRKKGTPIGTNDIWIAAVAIESGGHLLTFDEDYAKVSGLKATIL